MIAKFLHDTPCCFAFSSGRTGTNTLTALLASANDVDAYHEPHPRLLEFTHRAYQSRGLSNKEVAAVYTRSRRSLLVKARLRGHVFAECSNRLCFIGQQLIETFRRSRVIFLHRHPGDFVRSGMRRGWYSNHGEDSYRITSRLDDPVNGSWQSLSQFEKICWLWHGFNSHILSIVDHMPTGRVLQMSFDDFVRGESRAVDRIFRFVGSQTVCTDAHIRLFTRPKNAQRSGDFPRYDRWSEQQRRRLYDIAGPTMDRLGYCR